MYAVPDEEGTDEMLVPAMEPPQFGHPLLKTRIIVLRALPVCAPV